MPRIIFETKPPIKVVHLMILPVLLARGMPRIIFRPF